MVCIIGVLLPQEAEALLMVPHLFSEAPKPQTHVLSVTVRVRVRDWAFVQRAQYFLIKERNAPSARQRPQSLEFHTSEAPPCKFSFICLKIRHRYFMAVAPSSSLEIKIL